ncbi:MAG: M20/M25/M40 family metallo-hydrolase [Anaerolineae bacterium]|nr:M20/M25/M40 family metallo-hydrolase [Anaerolineae bacterium]
MPSAKKKLRPAFKVKSGTADFNILGPAWGCPIVAYGPGDSDLDHTPNEHVAIDEFERGVRVLARVLRGLTS